MIKNIKYLFIICLTIINLSTEEVFAASGTGGVTTDGTQNCDIQYTGIDANGNPVEGQCHSDYGITMNVDGKNYDAYCGDLNKHLGGAWRGDSFTCQEIADATIEYILSSNYTQAEKTAALRYHTGGLTVSGNAANRVNALIAEAQVYAGNTSSSLSFFRISASEANVTYNVHASSFIESVEFTCSSGCTVTNQNWNGYSGTITVSAIPGDCEFTINAIYNGNGSTPNGDSQRIPKKVVQCSGQNIQNTYYITDINTNTSNSSNSINNSSSISGGRVVQTFSDVIEPNTGGNYYKTYCDEEPNENLCECEQQTTISKPNYCDSPNSQYMSIKAPTDIKCCILNNKDEAGNTYQMLDGQISQENPYCTVYCKEDYEMTMPGAKYTDSGRYFELENTVIKAKKTCYATNPNKNSEEAQILIENFIQDVKTKQEALVNAYNLYKKAEKEKAQREANEYDTTDTTDCNDNTYTMYKLKSSNYTGYTLDCDNNTGKCIQRPIQRDTDQYEWGTKANKPSFTYYENGVRHTGCSANPSTIEEPNWDGKVSTAKENLTNALNDLKQTIAYMNECYHWVNNLCLDAIVNFDYQEQYSTNINYELVAGGGTITGENATYSTNKTLDNEYTTNTSGGLENVNYLYCDANGCNNTNEATLAEEISTLNSHLYYRKIEVEGTAEYANKQEFQTNYPHGTIDTVSNPENIRENYSYLGAVFPVALNTPTGVYKWKLNFTNLGQYNDYVGCRNGRLDTVVNAIGATTGVDTEYVCVYVVDCPECDYECVGEYCDYTPPEPKCPECDVYCINCIFNGEDTYVYRKIGNEFNPNNRTLGANWTSEKGEFTRNEIESTGENIYIEAEYTYVLDANNMKKLRDYNKETGTYVREDLTYHSQNNITNAYGTSKFLDEGQARGFFTEVKRNPNWTLWTGAIGSSIGPAWK